MLYAPEQTQAGWKASNIWKWGQGKKPLRHLTWARWWGLQTGTRSLLLCLNMGYFSVFHLIIRIGFQLSIWVFLKVLPISMYCIVLWKSSDYSIKSAFQIHIFESQPKHVVKMKCVFLSVGRQGFTLPFGIFLIDITQLRVNDFLLSP